MDAWIEFAKGPLFAVSFLIMILGLGRHLFLQLDGLVRRKGRRLLKAPWRKIFTDSLSWVIPVRHIVDVHRTVLFSVSSYIFHIGVIVVPLFLADHIILWERLLGFHLPKIGTLLADVLTVITIACLLTLLGCRLFVERQRGVSRVSDYVLLVAVLIPFLSGFLASQPQLNPISWRAMFLIHLLSAELLFVLIPFTKLAHIVLFFFDRISQVHWQLRPGAGDMVSETLYGKEAKV
ncbi:hypothetical protein K8I28_12080 [bacterium]|nr:hypothetical protein [bacterium]